MAKNSEGKASGGDIELHSDAWERFTEFVKRIAKAGPQHRPKKEDLGEQRPRGIRAPKRNLKG
jgi:hypothetical protein